MPLIPPNLDDRSFKMLVDAATRRARETCPEWTDHSPGDPGTVLLELFAYLTETMIYRLNRVPNKAYVQYLRLLGVKLGPPAAAVTTLTFSLTGPRDQDVEIPQGTRVAGARTGGDQEPPVFSTCEAATIPAGSVEIEVRAFHGELVEAELLGKGTGLPGLTLSVRRAPIIAPIGDGLDLVIGVEESDEESSNAASAFRTYNGSTFRIWREVEGFADLDGEEHVYVVDRSGGQIHFAPALRMTGGDGALEDQPRALAGQPAANSDIRAWYRTGGGSAGNVAAGMLTSLKDPIPGVTLNVSNPERATGGREAESLENALARGPQEIHSLRRAVTSRDYELIAQQGSGAVNRAYASTKYQHWRYAPRGTVEVILVPNVSADRYASGPVTPELLHEFESDEALAQIRSLLEERKPLGTNCTPRWVRCKRVTVKARVTVHREEEPAEVEKRVRQKLYSTINPLTTEDSPGWAFGKALSAYHVYQILASEPGVKDVPSVVLCNENTPDANVRALGADSYQPATWYAAADDSVFRTVNGGLGWERVAHLPGESVEIVKPFPLEAAGEFSRAGLVAAVTHIAGDDESSRVYLSRDCGESWEPVFRPQYRVEDMAWFERDGVPTLLLATEKGLFELAGRSRSATPILVNPDKMDLGFYALAVSTDVRGQTSVAVSARERGGVYLSVDGGKPGTFSHVGLEGKLVRVLAVQHIGANRYLWAGLAATGDDPGEGCLRWQLTESGESPEGWREFKKGWKAGSCRALAFAGAYAFAGSHRLGVLKLDFGSDEPAWQEPADVENYGLPLAAVGEFHSVDFVAAVQGERGGAPHIMAAGPKGVYRSEDGGQRFENSARREVDDRITLPPTWLLCSDEHDITVEYEHEQRGD